MNDWESIGREVWRVGKIWHIRFYLLNKKSGRIKIMEYCDGKLKENE